MDPVRVIDLGRTCYSWTQSLYHAIAERMTESSSDTIILCIPDRAYLCIGLHQNLNQAVDRRVCELLDLPIMRRRVGGGSTYLNGDQLFYQCIFHHSRMPAMPSKVYETLLDAPISTLRRIGLDAELRYENEIEVAGKRIAGVGGGRIGEASVVVGNFLRSFRFDSMRDVIACPREELRDVAGDAMEQCITTLEQEGRDEALRDIGQLLTREFSKSLGRAMRFGRISEQELQESHSQAEKLKSEEFLKRDTGMKRDDVWRFKVSGSTMICQKRMSHEGKPCDAIVRIRDQIVESAMACEITEEDDISYIGVDSLPKFSFHCQVGSQWSFA